MKKVIKLNSKNGKCSLNVEAHKFLGIVVGVDTYKYIVSVDTCKYKEKTRRTYVVMFLCFLIELEIVTETEKETTTNLKTAQI